MNPGSMILTFYSRYFCEEPGQIVQFSDNTQTDVATIQCQWNKEYDSTFPDISTAQCISKYEMYCFLFISV